MRTIVSLGIEQKFADRYTVALAKVRKTAIINVAALYFSGGLALSSYLIMMAVAIVFGSYTLAAEMEASAFDMIVPITTASGDTATAYYCADAMGALVNISYSPCAIPMQMTCSSATFMEMIGGTPLSRVLDDVPPEYATPSTPYLATWHYVDPKPASMLVCYFLD